MPAWNGPIAAGRADGAGLSTPTGITLIQTPARKLRSKAWFDNPEKVDMTALYLERYLNFGISLEELRSGRPIIGIAQTGSDLSPCNRHHLVHTERVREGSPSSFWCISSRRPGSAQQPAWIETSPISAS